MLCLSFSFLEILEQTDIHLFLKVCLLISPQSQPCECIVETVLGSLPNFAQAHVTNTISLDPTPPPPPIQHTVTIPPHTANSYNAIVHCTVHVRNHLEFARCTTQLYVCAHVRPYGAVVCEVVFQLKCCEFDPRQVWLHASFFSFISEWLPTAKCVCLSMSVCCGKTRINK